MAQLGAIIGVSLLAYMAAAWAAGKLLGLSQIGLLYFLGSIIGGRCHRRGDFSVVEDATAAGGGDFPRTRPWTQR